jgi:hypothetical protein
MAVNKTSLSVGEIIYDVLTNDAEVMVRANKVFPVVTDKATLPYVAYRRSRLEHNPAKGTQGADTVQIDVLCFAAKYGDGVQLAEAVRQALDGKQATKGTLIMRSCTIAGGEEYYENDAYIQELNFTIKV